MNQKKVFILSNCSSCPVRVDTDGERYCSLQKRPIKREDIFLLENNSPVDNKFPSWCPLMDFREDC